MNYSKKAPLIKKFTRIVKFRNIFNNERPVEMLWNSKPIQP